MVRAAWWLLRRLGFYAVAAWAALTLNFVLPRMMPGDPATALFGRFKGELTPEAMDALRATFGLTDEPLWRQYLGYLGHVAQGDLGVSLAYFPTPTTEVIGAGMGWTIALAGVAVVVAFVLGTGLGAMAAWRRGGPLDTIGPPITALLSSFPYFWLAMLSVYVLAFRLDWFPVRHAYGLNVVPGWSLEFVASVASHAILPALTMVVASTGGWMLAMRNVSVGTLGEDYVGYALARGLSSRRILVHYVARNAILPNLTGFGMALGFVVSGALLTEVVFSYPGTGYLLLQAVRSQDYPLMQGLFLAITLAVLGANWLADVATVVLDPRTR